tara:strand:- start:178 stop:558 length:381 start_codon:yes stop_codon:yes gene_type:complete
MFKKALILCAFCFISLVGYTHGGYSYLEYHGYKEQFSPEQSLHLLDGGKHLAKEFEPLLTQVSRFHPAYTKNEVTHLMVAAYQTIKEDKPEITIYEVTEGVNRFSDDNLGIGLETLITSYVLSQTK